MRSRPMGSINEYSSGGMPVFRSFLNLNDDTQASRSFSCCWWRLDLTTGMIFLPFHRESNSLTHIKTFTYKIFVFATFIVLSSLLHNRFFFILLFYVQMQALHSQKVGRRDELRLIFNTPTVFVYKQFRLTTK